MGKQQPSPPGPMFDTDPVSTFLDSTYLSNWMATEIELNANMGLSIPENRGCLYVVLRGSAWFNPKVENGVPVQLLTGDHFVVTKGMPHEVLFDLNSTSYPIDNFLYEPRNPPPRDDRDSWSTRLGYGSTRLLHGQFEISNFKKNPLNIGLPSVIHSNNVRDKSLGFCLPLLHMIETSQRDRNDGWKASVRRFSEMILLQTVAGELSRRVGDSSQSDSGAYQMMRAVTDTVIGPVLRALLDSPEFTWTVPQMARIADISKSSFSDRFRRLVGIPPLQYLTEIRMAKSRRLLAESNVEISEIALLVGYESASSFSNVFKRWHGNSPMEYRRGSRCRTEGTDGHSLTT